METLTKLPDKTNNGKTKENVWISLDKDDL